MSVIAMDNIEEGIPSLSRGVSIILQAISLVEVFCIKVVRVAIAGTTRWLPVAVSLKFLDMRFGQLVPGISLSLPQGRVDPSNC